MMYSLTSAPNAHSVNHQDLDTQLAFCRCMAVLSLKKGQVVCKQGDPPNGFFVILTGKVAIKVRSATNVTFGSTRVL